MTATEVELKNGALYLTRGIYDRYFAGIEAVILLRRDCDLCILPVCHAAAGGYMLKVRNKAGDRVAHAPDFFREHRVDDSITMALPVVWSTEQGALIAAEAFHL